jgi:hypothetical protein
VTKLSPRLPQGSGNGLADAAARLLANPHAKHVLLAIVDVVKVEKVVDTGEEVPVVRVRRVELLLREDAAQGEQLLRRALATREGRETLPFDVEDEITRLFADVLADHPTADPELGLDLGTDRTDDEDGAQ